MLKNAYLEIAERSIKSGEASLNAGIHEKAGFLLYHAFESSGGAYCSSKGETYPYSHQKKINMFVSSSRGERYSIHASQLAVELKSLRNLLLYPDETPHGHISLPKNQITPDQTKRLLGRVSSLIKRIKLQI